MHHLAKYTLTESGATPDFIMPQYNNISAIYPSNTGVANDLATLVGITINNPTAIYEDIPNEAFLVGYLSVVGKYWTELDGTRFNPAKAATAMFAKVAELNA